MILNTCILLRVNRSFNEGSKKLSNKFDLLEFRQQPTLMVKKTNVMNLSKFSLYGASLNVLEHDHNFVAAPRKIPHEDIIYCIEDSIKKMIRGDVYGYYSRNVEGGFLWL